MLFYIIINPNILFGLCNCLSAPLENQGKLLIGMKEAAAALIQDPESKGFAQVWFGGWRTIWRILNTSGINRNLFATRKFILMPLWIKFTLWLLKHVSSYFFPLRTENNLSIPLLNVPIFLPKELEMAIPWCCNLDTSNLSFAWHHVHSFEEQPETQLIPTFWIPSEVLM